MASFVTPFLHLYACTQSTQQLLLKFAELNMGQCAWRQGETLSSTVDSLFEQMRS